MFIKLNHVFVISCICYGAILVMSIFLSSKLNSVDSLVRSNSSTLVAILADTLDNDTVVNCGKHEKPEMIELTQMLDKNRYLNDKTKKSVISLVQFWSSHYNLPPKLVMSIILVESSGNPSAVSNRDAKGLMQILRLHSRVLDPYSIENNIMIGTTYLSYLVESHGVNGGVKRYFCGETNKKCLGSESANSYLYKVLQLADLKGKGVWDV